MNVTSRNRDNIRHRLIFGLLCLLIVFLFIWTMTLGAVSIPPSDIFRILMGKEEANPVFRIIIMESRLPMVCAALLAGAGLGMAGLLMQTTFRNPLAGPSVLGVSSGASLGVAIVMLSASRFLFNGLSLASVQSLTSVVGAFMGAAVIIALLVGVSSMVRNGVMLLVVGMFIGYLVSSVISLLNFFSPAGEVKAYMVWGLGSFASLSLSQLPWMGSLTIVLLFISLLMGKPLNAFLLGERYAASMGYSVAKVRNMMLAVSGALTAVVTAFCGPVAFLGLAVPHMARLSFHTSNHNILLPASILDRKSVV